MTQRHEFFAVQVVDKASGTESVIRVMALDTEDARRVTNDAGYMAGKVTPVDSTPATLAQANIPPPPVIPATKALWNRGRWLVVALALAAVVVSTLVVAIVHASLRHRPSRISIEAFIVLQSGSSQVERGLEIRLLRRTLPSKVVARIELGVLSAIEEARAVADAKDLQSLRTAAEGLSIAHDHEVDILKLQSFFAHVGGSQGLSSDTCRASWYLVQSESLIAITTTDIDGRAEFASVPPGDYYVASRIDDKRGRLDWLIPVHPSQGRAVRVMLTNSTAESMD